MTYGPHRRPLTRLGLNGERLALVEEFRRQLDLLPGGHDGEYFTSNVKNGCLDVTLARRGDRPFRLLAAVKGPRVKASASTLHRNLSAVLIALARDAGGVYDAWDHYRTTRHRLHSAGVNLHVSNRSRWPAEYHDAIDAVRNLAEAAIKRVSATELAAEQSLPRPSSPAPVDALDVVEPCLPPPSPKQHRSNDASKGLSAIVQGLVRAFGSEAVLLALVAAEGGGHD